MAVSYKKLWKLLIDRDMRKKDLCAAAGISHASMVKDIVIKKEKDGNYLVTVQYNYANSKELPNEESYSVPESIGSQDVELVETSGIEPLTS